VEAILDCKEALRHDRLQDAARVLAGVTVPKLVQKLVSNLSSSTALDKLLKVLIVLVEAEPESGEILEAPSAQQKVEQAIQRCGSEQSRQLWSRLEVLRTTTNSEVLRNVVHRHVREQAAAANAQHAWPEPAEIDVLPTIQELLQSTKELPKNLLSGWDDDDQKVYRQTHYLLYREELLAPLREAIASYLHSQDRASPDMLRRVFGNNPNNKITNFFAYPDTCAVRIAVSKSNQPMVMMKFSTGKRKIDFSLGSHLIYGSLVVLFEVDSSNAPLQDSVVYATVEEFDLRTAAQKQIVGICILDSDGWQKFSITKRYVMIESPGYFHAVRPVLEWLKQQDNLESVPLRSDLMTGDRANRVEFLQGVKINISCLYKRDLEPNSRWENCNPLGVWPDQDKLELDESQQQAMRHLLSCSVPLVQGPPGTGKSYIGVKAVQLLRQALNQKGYKEPILLICLTNHALDQFLEDLLDLFPDRLIRFGGRTKSEDERLLSCLVHNHMRSSKQDFDERKKFETMLATEVSQMDRLREFVSGRDGQIRLLLASARSRVVCQILNALGEDEAEAGLFLPWQQDWRPRPEQFIMETFRKWADGDGMEKVKKEASEWVPTEDAPAFVQRNAFAALDEDPLGEEWAMILNATDRAIATTNKNFTELTSHRFPHDEDTDDSSTESFNQDEDDEYDDDEVEAIMEDRMDTLRYDNRRLSRLSRGVGSTRARGDRVDTSMAINPAIQRMQAIQKAQQWEVQAVQAQRCMQEAEEEASEKPTSPAERAALARRLQRLHREAEGQRVAWRKAKEESRAAQVEIVCAKQRRRLEQLVSKEHREHLQKLIPENLSWLTRRPERKVILSRIVDYVAEELKDVFGDGFHKAQRHAGILGQMKKHAQLVACRNAAVVGMTSTFAALNRDLLQRLAPRVVVVEEAGELLECQLMACASSPSLQQVVLIGDHQQLRPKVNTYDLCRRHHLDISLFERLVLQGCDRAQLATQFRMQPDISDLVRPFYEQIDDHDRVRKYPQVPGIADTLYWVTHNKMEDNVGKIASLSKFNSYEAKFACRLAQHLVLNGTKNGNITILTPYLGQKREIKRHLPRELASCWVSTQESQENRPMPGGKGNGKKGKAKGKGEAVGKGKGKGKGKHDDNARRHVPGVRVVTIDDYQGEENDVVILSLVRSNPQGKLGFCSIENRIIVALSRARHGMYILGNTDMFKKDDHWFKVLGKLEAKDRVGEKLNLQCKKHPQDKGFVGCAEDFETVAKHGGCCRPCDSILPCCGHHCPHRCHPFDPEHLDVVCIRQCARPRPEGCTHKCQHMCRNCPGKKPEDVCPTPCAMQVPAQLPCGHTQLELCHVVHDQDSFAAIQCKQQISITLSCGHQRQTTCHKASLHKNGEQLLECSYKEQLAGPCGHQVSKFCHTFQKCSKRCSHRFNCGRHMCKCRCSEEHVHQQCPEPCDELLHCGHRCQNQCGEAHTDLCGVPCARECTHGWRCPKECSQLCVPCFEPCGWKCKHLQCNRLCHEDCDREPCNEPCDNMLECGHLCRGLCGEPCVRCVQCHQKKQQCPLSLEDLSKVPGKLYQLDCGHTFSVQMLDGWMKTDQLSGGHSAIQAKSCPTCRMQVHRAPRYQARVKHQLHLIDLVKKEKERQRQRPLTEAERREVDRAMGEGRSSAGHWFACPNGHPYFIGDCGGAMQESTCPECGARVGGGSHSLRADNTYISNFSGEGQVPPAWPGMNH